MPDLSKKPGTISYAFLQIFEQALNIQMNDALDDIEKREEILILAMNSLNDATTSRETYERKRNDLLSCKSHEDLIRLMQTTIENGKHYQEK